MAYNRFRKDLDPSRSGAFLCRACQKRTRETGWDESSVQLCKACLFEANRENIHSDEGHVEKGLGADPHACTVCTNHYPVLGASK